MTTDGTMTTTKLLFALLRSEICDSQEPIAAQAISEETLEKLYKLSGAHDLAHIVCASLHKHGLLGQDPISQKFRGAQMTAILRHERLKYALQEVSAVFEKEKIAYMPLKGSVLRDYYPAAWMRTSCDIDVLIHREDLDRAVDALVQQRGYKASDRVEYHDISLFSPSGVHLELHFTIQENMENIDRLLSKVWDYAWPQTPEGACYLQSKEYFLFHHLAHMSYHFIRGGCGIKPFMDLYIMNRAMDYDREKVKKFCKECGIDTFYSHVSELTDVWFSGKAHTLLTARIEHYILTGGVYGTLENQVLVAQSKQGSKAKYFLQRIFMPYESLKNYYPILNKHPYLTPILQVCRWFRILFRGDAKRSITELSYNNNVSRSQAEEMRGFLEEIGL